MIAAPSTERCPRLQIPHAHLPLPHHLLTFLSSLNTGREETENDCKALVDIKSWVGCSQLSRQLSSELGEEAEVLREESAGGGRTIGIKTYYRDLDV